MTDVDPDVFEAAADAVVRGYVEILEALMEAHPALIDARSSRPHRGTLLHYAATNGVEDERQRVPARALKVADLLIARGADIHAAGEAYGGGTTPLVALVTSVHPLNAGIMRELIEAFARSGQSLEGADGNGAPLLLAILFRNMVGARTLVALGARVDNAVTAAALGRTDLLTDVLVESHPPKAPPPRPQGVHWSPSDPASTAQWALIAASAAGEAQAVRLLLERGVALDGRWSHGTTALHEAAWAGHVDLVAQLVEAGAPLDARDQHHDATPLDWARHAGHTDAVQVLESAGR